MKNCQGLVKVQVNRAVGLLAGSYGGWDAVIPQN